METLDRESLSRYVCGRLDDTHPNMAIMAGTGVGKSKLALDILRKYDSKDFRTLVFIAERAHKNNWKDEIAKWYPDHKGSIDFLCYASMHKARNAYDLIVFDEAHHLNTDIRMDFFRGLFPRFRLFLSATLSSNFLNVLTWNIHKPITIIDYSLQDAIDAGIIGKPEIRIVPLELDNTQRTSVIEESWGKAKDKKRLRCTYDQCYRCTSTMFRKANPNVTLLITCTQEEHYTYLTKKAEYYKRMYETSGSVVMRNKWLQYGSRRKRFLGESKTGKVGELLTTLEGTRYICFCTSIEQANSLGGTNAIHSKSDKKALEDFNNLKSDRLFAVNMLQEGMNLRNIQVGVIVQLDGQKLRFIQKLGRSLRSDFPIQYIFYYRNTRDEEYLNNALEGINNEYIKEFSI